MRALVRGLETIKEHFKILLIASLVYGIGIRSVLSRLLNLDSISILKSIILGGLIGLVMTWVVLSIKRTENKYPIHFYYLQGMILGMIIYAIRLYGFHWYMQTYVIHSKVMTHQYLLDIWYAVLTLCLMYGFGQVILKEKILPLALLLAVKDWFFKVPTTVILFTFYYYSVLIIRGITYPINGLWFIYDYLYAFINILVIVMASSSYILDQPTSVLKKEVS